MAQLPRPGGQRGNNWSSEPDWPSREFSWPLRGSSLRSLSHPDVSEKRSYFKPQSSAWSTDGGQSGSGFFSTHSSSPSFGECAANSGASKDPERWQSLSRLASEGASWTLGPTPRARPHALQGEELVQRPYEAEGQQDSWMELLRARDVQLQHCRTSTRLLELRHKLAKALTALEQEKDESDLSRVEDTWWRRELQEKVLQMELDMMKMKVTLEREKTVPHRRSMNTMQENFYIQGKQQVERDLQEVRSALRRSQGRVQALEEERDQAVQQLRLSEEERDVLWSEVLKLKDIVEDHKVRLSGALADRDCLLQFGQCHSDAMLAQEKAELHQEAQNLGLQLHSAQQAREGFTSQLCELRAELADIKVQAKHKDLEMVQMEEELLSGKQLNEGLKVDLAEERQMLEVVSGRVEEMEAERLGHTNNISALEIERSKLTAKVEELQAERLGYTDHIAALEMERSKLTTEMEELQATAQQGSQEVTALRESCEELRKSQDSLRQENRELRNHCQSLEERILDEEVELQRKGEENEQVKAGMARELEELHREASQWKQRWREVDKALQSSQEELANIRHQQQYCPADMLDEELKELIAEQEKLQREVESNQREIQTLLQQKADPEAELNKVKGPLKGWTGSLLLRSPRETGADSAETGQGVRHPDAAAVQTEEKGTETTACFRPLELAQGSIASPTPGSTARQQRLIQSLREASLEEVNGDLSQVRAELQKVWDVLRVRDGELGEQQQDPQLAWELVSQKSSEVQRLEQQLTEKEHELEQMERGLRNLEKLRDTERAESQSQISSLELKIAELMEQVPQEGQRSGGVARASCSSLESAGSEATAGTVEDSALDGRQQDRGQNGSSNFRREAWQRNIDYDNQMRLVTEQLKSLFREREKLGWVYETSAQMRRDGRPLPARPTKSKLIKNTLATVQSQKLEEQELLREMERLQRAPPSGAMVNQQGEPELKEKTAQQKRSHKQDREAKLISQQHIQK